MDAWAGKSPHILLSRIGAYKLFYWDIQQIGPDMELESEVQWSLLTTMQLSVFYSLTTVNKCLHFVFAVY